MSGLKDVDLQLDALHAGIDRALEVSAPIFWDRAIESCHTNGEPDLACESYHRIWQYLVQWGVTRTLRSESEWHIRNLMRVSDEGRRRKVLISATADYNLLAHVLHAYRLMDSEAEIVISDICETPLLANQWYANRVGATITTTRSNALDYATASGFDIICTHSLFLFLSPEQQEQLVRQWFELLTPGGALITTTRLYAGGTGTTHERNPEEVEEFRLKVLKAATEHADTHAMDPDYLAEVGVGFKLGGKKIYRVSEKSFYENLYASTGYQIDTLELEEGRNDKQRLGPGKGQLGRLKMIVRKPG